jgi:hypothetical protein
MKIPQETTLLMLCKPTSCSLILFSHKIPYPLFLTFLFLFNNVSWTSFYISTHLCACLLLPESVHFLDLFNCFIHEFLHSQHFLSILYVAHTLPGWAGGCTVENIQPRICPCNTWSFQTENISLRCWDWIGWVYLPLSN